MLLPIKWLKDYVDIDVDTRIISDKLTDSGSHVEAISPLEVDVENVVVGKILEIDKHPNADKLVVTKIDVGDEVLTIVTGAKNVSVGDYVPVAKIGAVLADGMEIALTDFRGVDSYGMLCSLAELGYKDQVIPKAYKDGIYLLSEKTELGKDMRDVLEMHGEVMEFEITPNRPDCLSVIGMAREAAATFDKELTYPKIELKNEIEDIDQFIKSLTINEDLCNRYYGRVVTDLVIKDSPQWIQNRLMEAGVRPINNIVDITNYVMLEMGQPLHAFDLDKIYKGEIEVRRAKEDELIVTLDGVERKLSSEDLLIADGSKPLAIAGIMGAFDSEVTDSTKTIFLESANFDPRTIRLSSKNLNLRTDASSRLEKWLDLNLAEKAALRVCQLIEETGAGKVVKGSIDLGKKPTELLQVSVEKDKLNRLLGTSFQAEEIKNYLERLEFESKIEGDRIVSKVPSFRNDIKRDVDLIEEVGRLYGFHNIEKRALVGKVTRGGRPYSREVEKVVRDTLLGMGVSQIMSYSFISPKAYDKINMAKDDLRRESIRLINPLGEDYSIMRRTIMPNLLSLLSKNYNKGVKECLYFEIGNVFIPKELPVVNLPEQKKLLSIAMYGDVDFYYLKASLDMVFDRLGLEGIVYKKEDKNPSFHPNRTASIVLDGEEIGVVGEVYPDVIDNYSIKERVYIAEVDMETLIDRARLEKKFKSLAKYPSVSRDIAVVVDEDILFGDIEELVWDNNNGIIENIELFDVYSGGQIEEGKKSMAFSIVYRSRKGTLKDQEVNEIQEKILSDIEKKLDGKLRG